MPEFCTENFVQIRFDTFTLKFIFAMCSKKSFLFVIVLVVCIGSTAYAFSNYDYLYTNLPFGMNRVPTPQIPSAEDDIRNYGGTGDGVTLNTLAFEKAMKTLSERGGGHLIVPPGVWFTGPIVFRSNIDLHLEKGALILFSPDISNYPLVDSNYEGLDTKRCQSPISGRDLQNISITGEGAINGSGHVWRALKKSKVNENDWKKLTSNGGIIDKNTWYPSEKFIKGQELYKSNANAITKKMTENDWLEIKDFLRPVMISFINCKNVMLQGVLFENSPNWNIHPLLCENVIVDGIFARNPGYAQNGDGIDLESCKNALIINSTFDVGDDAICIKSGKNEEGRKRGIACENVIVDNCRVFQGHGGFVVGSEMSGGVRNISVSNCQFLGTQTGLRFKSCRGRGGVVENIHVTNIYMFDIMADAFLFDLYYGGKSAVEDMDSKVEIKSELISEMKVDETTPAFRNIYAKNIVSRNSRRALYFNGLPEMNIFNINIENSIFSARFGAELTEADGVIMKNVQIIPSEGPVIKLTNVKNVSATQLKYPERANPFIIKGDKSKNININLQTNLTIK